MIPQINKMREKMQSFLANKKETTGFRGKGADSRGLIRMNGIVSVAGLINL
jgi:hypothetical protein